MKTWLSVIALCFLTAPGAWAQHEEHQPSPHMTNPPKSLGFSAQEVQEDPMGTLMRRMRQQGSGTSLQPGPLPMTMGHREAGGWQWALHGNALLAWNGATGPRGYGAPSLSNWGMAMGSRVLGPGIADLRFMGSLDPATIPRGGTPQLFQTGETFEGRPLIDRQHPHDLFMELAGRYSVPWKNSTLFLYGGPVGEPALGPNAFMHRASAADNALAPLAHHIHDSTHISMGVLTGGVQWERWQAEASLFQGREPDENRWNIDFGPLDSYSGRLSFSPSEEWVLQASSGFLRQPEPGEKGNLIRTTASIHCNRIVQGNHWATALIWGRNLPVESSELPQTGWLLETTWDGSRQNHLYGRLEIVDKLGLLANVSNAARVGAVTLGFVHDLRLTPLALGLGGDVTLYSKPRELNPFYGDNPLAFRIFLRASPPK